MRNRSVMDGASPRIMKSSISSLALVLLTLLVGVINAQAQGNKAEVGKISGTLIDQDTGEPMIGVTVYVIGTDLGAVTDLDGKYTIRKVPVGTYSLKFSMVGYATYSVEEVSVESGEIAEVSVTMAQQAQEIKGIVVKAKALKNNEAALLAHRKSSVAVSDATSREEMTASGAGNAADAMTRVTGASVVGGKYVYIRGLGDRYTNTSLNGLSMPSADPDKQTFQMDLIPIQMLDNVVVQKTFTADKSGDFSGGSLSLSTRDFPEYRQFTFSTSAGYNTNTTGKEMLGYLGGDRDWLGYDDGTRGVPTVILENPELADEVPEGVRFINGTPEEWQDIIDYMVQSSEGFNPQMATEKETAPLDQSYALSYGDQFRLWDRNLGVMGSLTYKRNFRYYENGFFGKYRLASEGSTSLAEEMGLIDSEGSDEVHWGGMLSLQYLLNANNKIGANYVYNRNGESVTRYLSGKAYELENDTARFTYRTRLLDYTERTLGSLQLSGEHNDLLGSALKGEWQVGYSKTKQDEPDVRFFSDEYFTDYVEDEQTGDLYPVDGYRIAPSAYKVPTRVWRFVDEDSRDAKLDFTLPFGRSSKFKFGSSYSKKNRTQNERVFTYQNLNNYNTKFHGDINAFIADVGLESVRVLDTVTGRTQWLFTNFITENREPQNNFDGKKEIIGSYGMFEQQLAHRLNVVAGLRYETTNMSVENQGTTVFNSEPVSEIDEADLLPSLNLVYSLTDNTNLRAAYGRTLARPMLREMSGSVYDDFAGGRLYLGNPDLKHTRIDNYDLRLEWFMRPGEIAAVSGFYKNFYDPIELTIVDVNGSVSPRNVPKGTVYGLEFEMRTGLDRITSSLKHFRLGGNLTLVHSEVDLTESELTVIKAYNADAETTRPMAGQSPYLVNLDLGYDNPIMGTSLTLFYNVFGERLSFNAEDATPDIYEQPRHMLDLIGSQRVYGSVAFKYGVKNLLDSSVRFIHKINLADFGLDGSGDTELETRDFVAQEYKTGRSFTIGLSYSFD